MSAHRAAPRAASGKWLGEWIAPSLLRRVPICSRQVCVRGTILKLRTFSKSSAKLASAVLSIVDSTRRPGG